MSGIFGSTTIKGTRLTDFSGTSAEVGRSIPFGHGTFPTDGFVGWAPLPPVEHRQVKRQGKGGVKQETFTYTLSYGIWFCLGQIFGVKWIKRNGKVVYTTDPNAPLEDQEYAAKWAQRVNFHWGTLDQLPDSLIESYEGVGNVSGFPRMFYITIEDEDVTDNGGAPPNYEACVIATPPEAYLTTHPYTPRPDDSMQLEMAFLSAATRPIQWQQEQPPEELSFDIAFDSASTRDIFRRYDDEEELQLQLAFVSAETKSAFRTHLQPPESVEFDLAFASASTKRILVTHSNPPESIELDLAFVSASTSVP